MRTFTKLSAVVATATLTVGLAGCGNESSTQGGAEEATGGDRGSLTLGYIPSWTDGLSTAYLLDNRLTEMGYTVEHQELSEAALLYAGLAEGDVDVYPSAWPEVTHASYMEEYSDNLEDLGAYYENAKLTLAVPEYSELESIEDLKGRAADFDGKIIGIEPGAGLTKATQEQVIPQYDLAGEYELVTSSTTAMLSELKSATDANQDIVVTLWRPFWANSAFPVKDLEDPKGALGEAEALHFLAHAGFSTEHPEAAEFIRGIKMSDEEYGDLENKVVNEFGEGKEAEAVQAWLEAHPDLLPAVTG